MKTLRRLLVMIGNLLPMKIRIALYKMAGMRIGKGTKISKGLYVDRPDGIIIGDNCFINHFVHLHNGASPRAFITFGNNVFIGPEVKFFCASHGIGTEKQRAGQNLYDSIIVEDGVWIGANSTIFPGVRIAMGGVIGACSTVIKSTQQNSLYYGSPAKEVRKLENDRSNGCESG